MQQQTYWECFQIKTGRWVELKLYWVRLTLPAASNVVRVAVSHARLAVLIRQVMSRIFFCPDLNPVDYAVWGILQERVYKHQWITDVEELPGCRGGMGPSGQGSDWQCDQWMAQATDSLHCSRLRTFWTFTLNINAFIHIPINMF